MNETLPNLPKPPSRRWLRRGLFGVACLITLIALAYAEENWRGRHAWQEHRREWEAKGEAFDVAALTPPPVPDEKNFALTPLLKPALDFTYGPTGAVWRDTNGLERLQRIQVDISPRRATNDHLVTGNLEKCTFANIAACAEFYRGNTNYPQAAATATPAETILLALAKYEPELKELREAAASRPLCRFPIQYDHEPCWMILLPHLARVKALTQLACMRATAELELGRSADALEDLKVGFRLSDSIREEPLLIDHLVRIAALSIDLQALREGLVRHAWNEAQLATLQKHLDSTDILTEYKHAMRGERGLVTIGLDYLRRRGSPRDPMLYLSSDEGQSGSASALAFIPGGWYYQNMLTISRHYQTFTEPAVDERARRVFPKITAEADRVLEQMPRGPYTLFAKVTLPGVGKAVQKSARMQTYVDAARVACALERCRLANGALPDTLGALVPQFLGTIPADVIDGKPLRYCRNADGGYILYSVGWNQTDDGGQLAWVNNKKDTNLDVSAGDWVWQIPAR